MDDIFLYAPFLLVPFAVQLVILFAAKKRFPPLRFTIPVLAVIAGVVFFLVCILTAPPGWGLMLWPLAAVICLALAGLAVIGWGLAWMLWFLTHRALAVFHPGIQKHPNQTDTSGSC